MDLTLVLTRQQRLARFEAPNPWCGDEPDLWTVCVYRAVARDAAVGAAAAPALGPCGPEPSSWPQGLRFHQAIGIESADGRHHLLPTAFEQLSRDGAVSLWQLPALLHAWERRLWRSDFPIHLTRRILAMVGPLCALISVTLVVGITREGAQATMVDGLAAAFALPLIAWPLCLLVWRRRKRALARDVLASLPSGRGASDTARATDAFATKLAQP